MLSLFLYFLCKEGGEPMNTPFLMRTGILFIRFAKFMELRRISNIFANVVM